MSVHNRLYRPTDFPQLYAIEEICFQPPLRFPRSYMRRIIDNPASATWIAEEGDTMTAFAIVEWSGDPPDCFAYIQTIEVLPDHRGRGVGNELMRLVEDSARAAAAVAIWLHVESTNAVAIRLYRALGYKQQGIAEHYYARGRNADIYIKRLVPGA